MLIRNEKFLATIMLGFLTAVVVHFDYVRQNRLGRQAWMAAQYLRFDKYIVVPHWSILMVVSYVVFAALYIGLYECLVLFFASVSTKFRSHH